MVWGLGSGELVLRIGVETSKILGHNIGDPNHGKRIKNVIK
jgi:hypothetical protein